MKHASLRIGIFALMIGATPAFASAPIGWTGDAQPGSGPGSLTIAGGWTLDPAHPCQATEAYVELFELDDNGVVGALLAAAWVNSTDYRPDVNAIYCPGSTIPHGFEFSAAVPQRSGYYVRARGLGLDAGDVNAWLNDDHRFARRAVGNRDIFLRYRGAMTGVVRANNYESYPTVMNDNGVYKMWFAGGVGDKIYYATNSTGDPVNGAGWKTDWTEIVTESPVASKLDSGLVADPSVVKADGTFFMMYTATPKSGDCNRIFGAVSRDGVRWTKLDGAKRSPDNDPSPLIIPQTCVQYGAGQSSLIFGDNLPVGNTYRVGHGFVQFHTDTTAPGGGALLRTSEDGGWSWVYRSNLMMSNPPLGDVTWDFKYVAWSGQYFGAVAIPGDIGSDGFRHGDIGMTVGDGVNFVSEVRVPMMVLNPNPMQQCINNGGLLGNANGQIVDNRTVFYFGAGYLMNNDKYSRWPPNDWDIHAVDIKIY